MKEHQVEIMVQHTFTPSPTYTYRYRSELINAENANVWVEYLGQTIKTLISEEAMQSELFQKIEEGVRKYKEWEAGREERERKAREDRHRRSSMEKPRVNFIPKGLTVDYEQIYGKYLDQIIAFNPISHDDYLYQLHYLERWCKKSVPQILELGRPDAAYAIAMQVCRHIPDFLEKEELLAYNESHKPRIRKLIKEAYQALALTVTAWNHEENRRRVVAFMESQVMTFPQFRGLSKTLQELIPLTPFVGIPVDVV